MVVQVMRVPPAELVPCFASVPCHSSRPCDLDSAPGICFCLLRAGMQAQMRPSRQQFQIRNLVIRSIPVLVVYMIPGRYSAVIMLPYRPMQALPLMLEIESAPIKGFALE